jgi:hypothetical protein
MASSKMKALDERQREADRAVSGSDWNGTGPAALRTCQPCAD